MFYSCWLVFVKVGAAGEALGFVFLFEVRESGWKLLRSDEEVAFTELVELLGLGGEVDEKLVAHDGEFVLEFFRAVIIGTKANVKVGVRPGFGDNGFRVGFEGHEVFDADGSQGVFAGEDGGEGEVSFFWSGGDSAELGIGECSRDTFERFVLDVGGVLAGGGSFAMKKPKNNYDNDSNKEQE